MFHILEEVGEYWTKSNTFKTHPHYPINWVTIGGEL